MKFKTLGTIALIKGILLIILGVVHIAYSFFEYDVIKTGMSKEMSHQYILWFFAVGLFILFIGIIDIFTYQGIKYKIKWIWKTALSSAIFSFITGLAGVITFKWELCPPYVLFILGLLYIIALLLNRKEIITSNNLS